MFIIVWSHIQFFGDLRPTEPTKLLTTVVGIALRWTIPFFFIAAGYFFKDKLLRTAIGAWRYALSYSTRLVVVFAVWSLVYACWYPKETLMTAMTYPFRLILIGPVGPLWFLPSLVITVWIFVFLRGDKRTETFLLFGIIAFILGLLGGAYKTTAVGISLHIDTRNAFFFSSVFFGIGALLRERAIQMSLRSAWILTISGFVLYCSEAWFLFRGWGLIPEHHDYLLASIPWGTGMFLLALRGTATSLERIVGRYGPLTLGMYVSHYFFELLLRPVGHSLNPVLWEILFPTLVFTLSLLTTQVLIHSPFAWTVGAQRTSSAPATKAVHV